MSDKLELIARCLRDGVEVQTGSYTDNFVKSVFANINIQDDSIEVFSGLEYRAKPVNPRRAWTLTYLPLDHSDEDGPFNAVELTPSVIAALESAGIEI
jgi:hypothetical protein